MTRSWPTRLGKFLGGIRLRQQSLAIGSAITLVFNGLSLLAYGLGTILVVRKLEPDQAGKLTWFISSTQLMALFSDFIGVYYSNLQLTASASHDYPVPQIRTTVLLYAAVVGVSAAAALVLIPVLHSIILPGYDGPEWTFLAISAVSGTMLINQVRGLFWSQGSFILVGILWVLRTSAYTAVAVTGAYWLSWKQSSDFAFAHALSAWICVAGALVYFGLRGFGRFRMSYLRLCWRTGIRGAGQNMLTLAHQRTDQFVITRSLTWSDLGLYSVIINFADMLAQIPGSIGMVAFSNAAREKDRALAARQILRRIAAVMAGMALLAIILLASAPYLIPLLYGPKFAAAGSVLIFYLPVIIIQSGVVMANSYASAGGYPLYQLAAAAAALATNASVGTWLSSAFGLNGTAAAVGLSWLVWLVLLSRRIIREAVQSQDVNSQEARN